MAEEKSKKKRKLILAAGRTIEQVQAEDYPLPFNLKKKEKEIEKHFEDIHRIRENAVKEEIPEDRGIMLGLADIFQHRQRFLDEKYWFPTGKKRIQGLLVISVIVSAEMMTRRFTPNLILSPGWPISDSLSSSQTVVERRSDIEV